MSKEEHEEFHNELIEIEETLESRKQLIKTHEMQKFYDRTLHYLRWLQMEVEGEFTEE